MIRIGNKKHGDKGEYVGRPSPLGNPFKVKEFGQAGACAAYEQWFSKIIKAGPITNPSVFAELDKLYNIYIKNGELTLLCWCAPKRCHSETIRNWLEERLLKEK